MAEQPKYSPFSLDFSWAWVTPATIGQVQNLKSTKTNPNSLDFTWSAVIPAVLQQISVNPIPVLSPNASFTISGKLVGYDVPPALRYIDDAGNSKAVPALYVTPSSFVFTHPSLTVGLHTVVVTDGNVSGTLNLSVVTPYIESKPGTTIIHYTDPPIVDSTGMAWRLTLAGKVSVNNVADQLTSNAVLIYYNDHRVYQKIKDGRWWWKGKQTDTWISCPSPITTTSRIEILRKISLLKGLINNSKLQKILGVVHSDVKNQTVDTRVTHARIATVVSGVDQGETKVLEILAEIKADLLAVSD